MDSEILAAMSEGAATAETLMGEAFTYRSATYTGISAQLPPSVEMLMAGERNTQEWTIKATKGQFAGAPVAKESITLRGMALLIKSVDTDLTHYTLYCVRC